MDGSTSASEQQMLVSSFLEIAVGQTADTARQFLQATSWKLDEAIQLFYIGNEGGAAATSFSSPPLENDALLSDPSLSGALKDTKDNSWGQGDGDGVRAPLPVKRDVLYDNALYGSSGMGGSSHGPRSVVPFRNFEEEMKRPGVWEAERGSTSSVDATRDNLASLYRPPFSLMYHGPFEKAKDAAVIQNKWLLVNLQSTREFSSHMLNRDTWTNEAAAQTIKTNFIFWQVYDDTEEGSKVCTYYKLESMPVILVIDPITGQKMRSWCGMVQPENLLEGLLSFMDGSPSDYHVNLSHKRLRETPQTPHQAQVGGEIGEEEELQRALAASMEGIKDPDAVAPYETDETKAEEACPVKKPSYPSLPEEPKGDRSLICRVAIRLPDGRRIQRNFLRTDSTQLLWSFCSTQLEEGELRPFRFTQAIPGASKYLEYDSNLTFEESGLANSIISVSWE